MHKSITFGLFISSVLHLTNVIAQPRGPYTEQEIKDIREEILKKTNILRKRYDFNPLVEDTNITTVAQNWANQLAKMEKYELRPDNQYGENLYVSYPLLHIGEIAVDEWYFEVVNIKANFDEKMFNNCKHDIINMSQMMWKDTTKMGAGVAIGTNGKCYIVVDYEKKGNIENKYKENLPEFDNHHQELYNAYIKNEKIKFALNNRSSKDFFPDEKLPGWESELPNSAS